MPHPTERAPSSSPKPALSGSPDLAPIAPDPTDRAAAFLAKVNRPRKSRAAPAADPGPAFDPTSLHDAIILALLGDEPPPELRQQVLAADTEEIVALVSALRRGERAAEGEIERLKQRDREHRDRNVALKRRTEEAEGALDTLAALLGVARADVPAAVASMIHPPGWEPDPPPTAEVA